MPTLSIRLVSGKRTYHTYTGFLAGFHLLEGGGELKDFGGGGSSLGVEGSG